MIRAGLTSRAAPWLLAAALACGTSRGPSDPAIEPLAAAPERPSQHLLLVVRAIDHRIEVVSARIAPVPLPLDRAPSAAAPDAWRVELLDAGGARLATTELRPPDVVRGEFAGEGGAIEAHHTTAPSPEFLVRFPVSPGAAAIAVSGGGPAGARARRELGRAPLPPLIQP